MKEKIIKLKKQLSWTFMPETEREASDAIVRNFLLHWFPAKVTTRSSSFSYTLALGSIAATLFAILTVSGVILMFLYVPSVERAYWSIKDLEFVVSFGWFIRGIHRLAAHLMVAVVFLHMVRIFFTGAYKMGGKAVGSFRPMNWWIGLALLVITLLLSYTGYLLPWDQLALWAITIGVNIARAVPIVGNTISLLMVGGTIIDQGTLIRWYVAHVALLPMLCIILIPWHIWRIRKDNGLACVESLARERIEEDKVVVKGKTYSMMGIVKGITPTVISHKVQGDTVPSSPYLTRRIVIVFILTLAITMGITFLVKAPLEEPANLNWTPNPAKAPWYFLWLQELVADTTLRLGKITINGGFVGGVIIPGILFTFAALWPLLDKSPHEAIGMWFHKTRKLQNISFFVICLIIIALIYFGSYMRGPYWKIYMPWQPWIQMPTRF